MIFLWSKIYPGPGWHPIAMARRNGWINWLWCLDRPPLAKGEEHTP